MQLILFSKDLYVSQVDSWVRSFTQAVQLAVIFMVLGPGEETLAKNGPLLKASNQS